MKETEYNESFYEGMSHARLIILRIGLHCSHEMAKRISEEILKLFGNKLEEWD